MRFLGFYAYGTVQYGIILLFYISTKAMYRTVRTYVPEYLYLTLESGQVFFILRSIIYDMIYDIYIYIIIYHVP